MLEATQECLDFTKNRKRKDLETNRMLSLSIVRLLEIIGEAASKLSKGFQNRHPQIPWKNIIGMRNRLIHAYFDIEYDYVWKAVTDELPELAAKLQRITAQEK